jgi:hypothetical protein
VEFRFTQPFNTNLLGGGVTLVVRNAAAFRSRYGQNLPIAGEFTGRLDNNGERIRIEDRGEVVLDFRYPTDGMPKAHGGGRSIVVADTEAPWNEWGNPLMWAESDTLGGTPGSHTSRYLLWTAQRFTVHERAQPNVSGSFADADGDGDTNLREMVLGTNPRDAASLFGIRPLVSVGKTRLQFEAAAGKTYTVQVRDGLTGGEAAWKRLQDVGVGAARVIEIADPIESSDGRYYRLVTPVLP